MSRRYLKIVPRKRIRNNRTVYYVRTPDDLMHKNMVREKFDCELKDAQKRAKMLTDSRYGQVNEILKLSEPEQSFLCHLLREIGLPGIRDGAALFLERKPLSQLGVPQVAAHCLIEKATNGVRKNSLATLKWTFDSFADHCQKSISAIETEDIKKWLAAHPQWTAITRHRRIGDMSTLFQHAVRQKMRTDNPCDSDHIERPKVVLQPAKIYSVDDLEKLLVTCRQNDAAFLGWMAPVIFGGLRVSESQRMAEEDVTDEVIALESGDQTKKNNRRAFEIQPVLKAWLDVPGVKIKPLSNDEKQKRFKNIAKLAGVKLIKNGLRKSCASYWVKLVGSKEAARILGHSETMLHQNYANNRATLADAKRFEALRPQTCAELLASASNTP